MSLSLWFTPHRALWEALWLEIKDEYQLSGGHSACYKPGPAVLRNASGQTPSWSWMSLHNKSLLNSLNTALKIQSNLYSWLLHRFEKLKIWSRVNELHLSSSWKSALMPCYLSDLYAILYLFTILWVLYSSPCVSVISSIPFRWTNISLVCILGLIPSRFNPWNLLRA